MLLIYMRYQTEILINQCPDLSDLVSYIRLVQVLMDKQKELLTDALAILYRLQREKRLDHEKQRWIGLLEKALQPIASGRDEPPVEPIKP